MIFFYVIINKYKYHKKYYKIDTTNMSNNLIVLVGEIGVGKSTVAEMMTRMGYHEETFAGPLKQIGEIFGFEYKELYGTQADKRSVNNFWGISGREFLQKFGTDVCRVAMSKVIPNMNMNKRTVWARIMEKKIKSHKNLVISDGRFPDEIALVKEYGGTSVKIIRTKNKNDDEKTKDGENAHSSESYISKIKTDYTIYNYGNIDELFDTVEFLLDAIYEDKNNNIENYNHNHNNENDTYKKEVEADDDTYKKEVEADNNSLKL